MDVKHRCTKSFYKNKIVSVFALLRILVSTVQTANFTIEINKYITADFFEYKPFRKTR